jgi:Xaa-Pro aminopeptidase
MLCGNDLTILQSHFKPIAKPYQSYLQITLRRRRLFPDIHIVSYKSIQQGRFAVTQRDSRTRKAIIHLFLICLAFMVALPNIICGQSNATSNPAPIGMDTFKSRRLALMDSLGEGTALLYSQGRNTETGYRPGSDFWYLTGIDEPGAILMLSPGEYYKEVIFLPPRDPESERWSYWRPELTDSLRLAWKVDKIRRTSDLNWMIVERMKHSPVLQLISQLVSPDSDVPKDKELYGKVSKRIPGVKVENSSRLIESMRMIKSPDEIAAIEKAIAITYQGITEVLAEVRPGITEYQLEAVLESSFKQQGSQHMAFGAIIAAGGNSHFLHYQKRHDSLKAGQLLLMDVGARWDHYASDITRTFPIDGKFTPAQAEIYDIVLKAQNAAIAEIKPGATYYKVDEAAREVLRQAGYIDDYWHGTGHHLGISTHDPGDRARPFEPGMVITVEPGIYLPDMQFGIRIEDDVLVTKYGHRILSEDIPRAREEVEEWIRSSEK